MNLAKVISGTLLIAGTTIGAGMLGIPLLTARAGFWPAALITCLVWLFMVCTGFLYLEATLWMQEGSNILSMSKRFLGRRGQWCTGAVYLFLYYCLLVAYFAAGAPLLAQALGLSFGSVSSCLIYGLLFGIVVAFGMKVVDRINYILTIGMFVAYAALLGGGAGQVQASKLTTMSWSQMLLAAPILFSAFGYHNVIPSLVHYFHRNVRVLRASIVWGTAIPLVVYLLWQWLIIGAVPEGAIREALEKGQPATAALQSMTHAGWIVEAGQFFAFFAIVTSMLGVAFSMVDFLGDGLGVKRHGMMRGLLTVLTFLPPFLFTAWNPNIFVTAIGFAGGFGEAFLNGLLPVLLVWLGRYHQKAQGSHQLRGGRWTLAILFGFAALVMVIEGVSVV